MACAAYAVDRTQLRRRGIVPVLEEKRAPRALAVIENIPMPRLIPELSKGPEEEKEEVEATEEAKEMEHEMDEMDELNEVNEENEMHEVFLEAAAADRLPKPTGVQSEKTGKERHDLKERMKSSRTAKFTQPRRPRSTEKTLRQVQAAQAASRKRPETRDIASSPMSPGAPGVVQSVQSESLNGLLKELGSMREDYIVCKLEGERARERSLQVELENAELKRQLAESEKLNRQLMHEKQELQHLETLWRQRWEDSQRQVEDSWKRFDALKAVIESKAAESQESHQTQVPESSSRSQDQEKHQESPSLASDGQEEPPGKAPAQAKTWTRSMTQGFQTPPFGSMHLAFASPRTMPAMPSFPSPRIQPAVRIVMPQAAPSVYYTHPAQAGLQPGLQPVQSLQPLPANAVTHERSHAASSPKSLSPRKTAL